MKGLSARSLTRITTGLIVVGGLLGFLLGGWIWVVIGLLLGWLIGAGVDLVWARIMRSREDPWAAREALVRDLMVRWEWRLVGSDEAAVHGDRAALGRQAQEELQSLVERERTSFAAKAAAANVAAEAARERVDEAAANVPPEPREPAAPQPSSSRFNLGIPTAILLTLIVVALAVLATGAVVDLTAASTFVPLSAITVLAAAMGGVAGATLTWERTPWAIGIAVSVLVLGSLAAFLVAWVAGLAVERAVLLLVLFAMLAVMSAAIWAFRALAVGPREVRTNHRSERRKYEKALEQRNARLASVEAAKAAKGQAETAQQSALIELEAFDKVADAWRQELTLVGQRGTRSTGA